MANVAGGVVQSIYLNHPMSRRDVALPPLPPWVKNWTSLRFTTFILSSNPLSHTNFMIFVAFVCPRINFLAFTQQDAQEWLLIDDWPRQQQRDMIFHGGHLYVCDTLNCQIWIYKNIKFTNDMASNLSNITICSLPPAPSRNWRRFPFDPPSSKIFRLVISTSGELMIVEQELMGIPPRTLTYSIRVHKLVTGTNVWEEINNFDVNQALFLAPNESMFFPTDGQEYKPNCIYFLEYNTQGYDAYGVYDLGNHRVRHFDLFSPRVGVEGGDQMHIIYNPMAAF